MLENIDYVICPICNTSMKELSQHLVKIHKISINDFKLQYPNNKIICDSLYQKRISSGIKGGVKTKLLMKDKFVLKKQKNIEIYNLNPKKCKQCNDTLIFSKRKSIFCTQNCAVTYSNKKRIENGYVVSDAQKEKVKNTFLNKFYFKDETGNYVKKYCKIKFYKCILCNKTFVKSRDGNRKYKYCSKTCQHIVFSNRAKSNKSLNKNNNKHSGWYESLIAGKVWLESSWEVKIAKSLDENNVNWIRPKNTFTWIDSNNKAHKYYPDFYLIDYDVYLDPKNPHKILLDAEKLNYVKNNYDITLLILNKKQLSWDIIKDIIYASVAKRTTAAHL